MLATRDSRVAYIEMSSSTDVFLRSLEVTCISNGQAILSFPVDSYGLMRALLMLDTSYQLILC